MTSTPSIAASRLLTLVVLDDEATSFLTAPETQFTSHFDVVVISSWSEAQGLIGSTDTIPAADLLLTDISWQRDAYLRFRTTGMPADIAPLGPLLALPFLGRRMVMNCTIYSSRLKDANLHEHPLFLFAMGLIGARTEGIERGNALHSTILSPEAKNHELDRYVQELKRDGANDASSALQSALPEYRETLANRIRRGEILLGNREGILSWVEKLRVRCGAREAVLLDNSIYVELLGGGWRDRIALRSLFADSLCWVGKYATLTWLDEIAAWINGLGAKTVAEHALDMVVEQNNWESNSGDDEPLEGALERVRKKYPDFSAGRQNEIFRYLVLFANVYANEHLDADEKAPVKERIFERLCTEPKLQVATYRKWFGRRDGNKPDAAIIAPLCLPNPGSNDPYWDIFLNEGSVISAADARAIQAYRETHSYDLNSKRAGRYLIAGQGIPC